LRIISFAISRQRERPRPRNKYRQSCLLHKAANPLPFDGAVLFAKTKSPRMNADDGFTKSKWSIELLGPFKSVLYVQSVIRFGFFAKLRGAVFREASIASVEPLQRLALCDEWRGHPDRALSNLIFVTANYPAPTRTLCHILFEIYRKSVSAPFARWKMAP